jgi:hypothetical protein
LVSTLLLIEKAIHDPLYLWDISESSGNKKRKARKGDPRNIIAQARIKNARYAWREENYEDNKKEMGALCFTRRVRRTGVPKGFKLPYDQQKYNGSQKPTLWLLDYLQAVQILGGTRVMRHGVDDVKNRPVGNPKRKV